MTPFRWILAAVAGLIVAGQAAALGYTVAAMQRGWVSVSAYMAAAPRWVVAATAFGTGLAVGTVFAHWWFPTTGKSP